MYFFPLGRKILRSISLFFMKEAFAIFDQCKNRLRTCTPIFTIISHLDLLDCASPGQTLGTFKKLSLMRDARALIDDILTYGVKVIEV